MGQLVVASNVRVTKDVEILAAEVAKVPQLGDFVAGRGELEGQVNDKTAKGTSSNGVCRPASIHHVVDMVAAGCSILVGASAVRVTKDGEILATEVAKGPQLGDLVAGRGMIEGSVNGKAAMGTKLFGVGRPAFIHHVVDTVEPRQSERIKNQNSGGEDLVQKAKRRAQIRNLEFDPSYLIEWVLDECLGKPAEIGPERVHVGGKPKIGVCGEANPQFSWVEA